MQFPEDLRYTESHEWVRSEADGTFTIGISDHAQNELGEVIYVELPEQGHRISTGDSVGVLESVKAISDIYAPLDGEVVAINSDLTESPNILNESPYEQGWLYRIRPDQPQALDSLLDAQQYRQSAGV